MKRQLYTKEGWIDARLLVHSPASFVIGIGGRGIGKTYGCLKILYEEQIPFIYMRRTQAQIDSVTIQSLNPYNQVSKDLGKPITSAKMGKYVVGFYNGETAEDGTIKPTGDAFGIAVALSTFANIRGMSAEKYQVLLFDEVIPERHEKSFSAYEDLAFSNMLESLNRNRELRGEDPLKVILLSNSNTINSKILSTLGVLRPLDKMIKRGTDYLSLYNGDMEIYRYLDSPISDRKRNTVMYKVLQNKDFQDMALDNAFSANDYEYIKVEPLAEYNPIVSIDGITAYVHKSKDLYYIVEGEKASKRYQNTILEVKAFRKAYSYLYRASITRRIYYSSIDSKIKFERLWE